MSNERPGVDPDMPVPCYYVRDFLRNNEVNTVGFLLEQTDEDLLSTHGFGHMVLFCSIPKDKSK